MNKQIAVIFVITSLLMSTISYSQSVVAPNTMKSQIESEQKSEYVLSIGGGFASSFEKYGRHNGFNIQADLLYPVSEYFALNIGINYTQFPGYHYDDYDAYYSAFYNDTIYTHSYGDGSTISHLQLRPGVSFGNININNKINYYLTAGLTVGINIIGQSLHYHTSSYGNTQIETVTYGPFYDFNLGGFVSGRISYKVSDKLNIFIEPSAFSNWSDSYYSNYHINGGVSLAL